MYSNEKEMGRKDRMRKIRKTIIEALALVYCNVAFSQTLKHIPYEHAVGTVHQFGFIGGLSVMRNPNIQNEVSKRSYIDYSMGAVYNYRNYLTKQLSIESTVSITMQTAKALREVGAEKRNQKMILPVDVRISVGPSEDITLFLGTGLQWSVVTRNISEMDDISLGKLQSETAHQMSGNSTAGFSFLGPSKYSVHLSVGLKFHYPVQNCKPRVFCSKRGDIDVSCDKSSMSWTGSLTYDLDKKKRAVVMLNYELPLEKELCSSLVDNDFRNKTQMLSLGLMFYLGGSR